MAGKLCWALGLVLLFAAAVLTQAPLAVGLLGFFLLLTLLLVLEVLNDQQRYTPGSFGLITLNSQNNALSGNARVNAISSATNELATLITDRIQAHADGLIDQLPTIAITPTIHEGETLCIRQKS